MPKTLTISTVASSSGERPAQVVSTTPRAVQDAAANVLAGTVTSVTSLRYEPPDFDVYRFVSQVIILTISLPVFSFRVRDDQGRDHQARIKGLIEGEYPGEGDQVELQGRWHNGTFIVEQGLVYNVGARFRVRPSRWRWVLFCFLFIIAMVACFWAFTFEKGVGARHMSAQRFSAEVQCVSIVVSEDGSMTIYCDGKRIWRL